MNRPPRILILVGDITYNLGDRGILSAMIDHLRDLYPNCDIVYDSYDTKQDGPWYPATVIGRGVMAFFSQIWAIMRSDVVLWGGGGLHTDNASNVKVPYWFVKILAIKWLFRKKVMTWSLGVIVKKPMSRFLTRILMNALDVVTVRDENSREDIINSGVDPERVIKTADPAILMRPSSAEVGKKRLLSLGVPVDSRPIIAMAASFCSFHYKSNALIPHMYAYKMGLVKEEVNPRIEALTQRLARLADHLVEKHGAHIVFIPAYNAPWEKDQYYLEKTRGLMRHSVDATVVSSDHIGPKDHVSNFYNFALTVSIPMHQNIFSHVCETPSVNLFYEPKGRDFFRELGYEEGLISIHEIFTDEGFAKIAASVDRALTEKDRYWPGVLKNLEKLKLRALQNGDYLKKLLNGDIP